LARCVILFNYQDRAIQEFFIEKINESGGLDPKIAQQLQRRAQEKLELALKYATTHRCRRQMILDYFGDETEVINCQCDVCRRGEISAATETVVLPDEIITLVRQLLSAIARLNGKFGVGVVSDVLAGNENEKTQRWGFERLSVFGLLRAHGSKRIVAMLHRIMEAGLARQRDPDHNFRPVVELTAAGIAVMKGQQPPPASLSDLIRTGQRADGTNPRALGTNPRALGTNPRARAVKRDEADFAEEHSDPETIARFEKLRAARLDLARARELPPYCICHDSTLRLIARFAPKSLESLEQIKGMGPYKVKLYGEKLLEAIKT